MIALLGGRPSDGPPEFCSVFDDTGEDDGELACKRDTRPLEADAFGESEAPGLEAGEPFDDRQKHGGRFVQQGSDHPVAPFRDAPLVVDLSGLVPARRQAEVRSHLTRLGETAAVVDRTQERQGDDWANAWYIARRAIEMSSVSSLSISAMTGSRACRSASVAAASAGRAAQLVRTRTARVRRSPGGAGCQRLQQAANGILEILPDAT